MTVPPARRRCQQLLEQALATLAGDDGAVFGVGADGVLRVVASQLDAARFGREPFDHAISLCRHDKKPLMVTVPSTPGPSSPVVAPSRYLVAPLEVDRETVGVLVVGGLGDNASIGATLSRLGYLPETIALNVDRARVVDALDRRGDELTALRQQLDAFALDFRSTYAAERARSEQLSVALAAVERTYRSTVSGLAMAVEAKDECTGGHLYRVSRYGLLVTAEVAPEHASDPQFEFGFLLHDVGKLMVPDEVLNKPGALTDAEWLIMRAHAEKGRSILEGIDFLEGARDIVYAHHERWDGRGYPQGLRETEIPLGARIFPLCDAFDAMTSDRPYRKALPMAKAMDEIWAGAGTQFWSEAVDAFMGLPLDSVETIMRERRSTAA